VKDLPGLQFAWYHRILPLLQEYFYGDGERLRAVVGEKFVREVKIDPKMAKSLGDAHDSDRSRFRLNELEGTEFVDALRLIVDAGTPAPIPSAMV
jgi:hypothetical protein